MYFRRLVKRKTYRITGYNTYTEYLSLELRVLEKAVKSHCVLFSAKLVPARMRTKGNELPKQPSEQLLNGSLQRAKKDGEFS
jgi:hypothetical protein